MATAQTTEVTKVSKEAIEKAEIALGLRKAEEATVTDADKTKTEELKKAEDAKVALEKEYADTIAKAEELKGKIEGAAPVVVAPIVKAIEEKKFDGDAFQKAFDDKFTQLGVLIQSKNEQIEELSTKLQKAEEFNALMGKKIGIIEKQPLDRKAVTTASFIEKGGDGKTEGGEKVLSLTANQREVSDMLFAKAVVEKDGKEVVANTTFAKAAQYVELGILRDDAKLTRSVQDFFKKEHNIVLTK